MEKTQVYLRKDELDALREAAARSGGAWQSWSAMPSERSCSSRRHRPGCHLDGEPKRTSVEHDSVHDEP